jgi:hypothetical protein
MEELELNQKFIDLIYEYDDLYENEPELKHPKGLVKYIWNSGYKISPRYLFHVLQAAPSDPPHPLEGAKANADASF